MSDKAGLHRRSPTACRFAENLQVRGSLEETRVSSRHVLRHLQTKLTKVEAHLDVVGERLDSIQLLLQKALGSPVGGAGGPKEKGARRMPGASPVGIISTLGMAASEIEITDLDGVDRR